MHVVLWRGWDGQAGIMQFVVSLTIKAHPRSKILMLLAEMAEKSKEK